MVRDESTIEKTFKQPKYLKQQQKENLESKGTCYNRKKIKDVKTANKSKKKMSKATEMKRMK